MNIKEIKELIELIEKSGIEEFEIERSGVRIRVRKTISNVPREQPEHSRQTDQVAPPPVESPESEPALEEKSEQHHIFTAPIVGTFYITPKPDAEPFVKVGDRVSKGTVLCVIEAMKIFNQIESDVDGEIVKIHLENGEPVEYGQPLFDIQLTD